MTGLVLAHHALLNVSLRSPAAENSHFLAIEFVIDTRFVGFLTLPPTAVQALGLPFRRRLIANLADNSAVQVDVYGAEIVWQNRVQTVEVLATGARPLLGMLLLDGCEMNVRFANNETVTVTPL